MFTGIIQSVGSVFESIQKNSDIGIGIQVGQLEMKDVSVGDSIAVNGVCLTAIKVAADRFWADVSVETLDLTGMGALKIGSSVNLEKALTLSTPLGGHLVSGHVDGVGELISRQESGRSTVFVVKAPDSLAKYISVKGSICIDGISLTVNSVKGAAFELTIVPHTLQETIMGSYQPGCKVNLEVDLIARYLERLLLGDQAANPDAKGIDQAFLQEHGFIK